MPSFKIFTATDEVPPVPEGWLYVSYPGEGIKIVDTLGHSMSKRSRALVKEDDARVQELLANGSLKIISHATVSLDNYIEATVDDGVSRQNINLKKIKSLKNAIESSSVTEVPRKTRKKKQDETDEVDEPTVIDDVVDEAQLDVAANTEEPQELEISTTDTSTSEEEPSV